MSYLKSVGTSFVYIAFFLAVITFTPGLPPKGTFTEYSIKPAAALEGVYALNNRLDNAELYLKGKFIGPECFDVWKDEIYIGLKDGYVAKITADKIVPIVKFGKDCDGNWEEDKCGRPLGLKFDKRGKLYVIDTYYGIFEINASNGKYKKIIDLTKLIDGRLPLMPNQLDVAENGDIYWSDSSTEFKLYDGLYSVLADPDGRLLRYNAATKKNEVLLDKLGFPNGVKLSDDESYVLISETQKLSIVKYYLKGPKAGTSEILIDGLPGCPDNIHTDGLGNYLASFVIASDSEHPQLSQTLIPHPYLRKMLTRLLTIVESPFKLLNEIYPNIVAKKVIHAIGSFETNKYLYPKRMTIIRFDGDGKILDTLHNTDEKIAYSSSAIIHDDYLWVGSPWNDFIARVPLKQAFPNTNFVRKSNNQGKLMSETPVRKDIPEGKAKASGTATTTQKASATPKSTTVTPKPTTATPKSTTATPKQSSATTTAQKLPSATATTKIPSSVEAESARSEVTSKSRTKEKKNEREDAEKNTKETIDMYDPPLRAPTREETDELPKPIKIASNANKRIPDEM